MSNLILLDHRRAAEWRNMDLLLEEILLEALDLWPSKTMRITSIYRTPDEDRAIGGSGIHATIPHRAADVKTTAWNEPSITSVVRAINRRWVYDPSRPSMVVALYKPHGTGPHVHFQVHSRTRRRVNEEA